MPAGSAAVGLALAFLFQASPERAAGATHTVTTLVDELTTDGACSLREAIAAHNAAGGSNDCGTFDAAADTITFAVTGTITMNVAFGTFDVHAPDLTISGPGPASLTVDGGDALPIFTLNAVDPPNLTVRRLALRHGRAAIPASGNPGGGAIAGPPFSLPRTIVVEDAELSDNTAPDNGSSRGRGAAVAGRGTLSLRRVSIARNTAYQAAVYHSGTLEVEDSTFDGNTGGFSGAIELTSNGAASVVQRTLFRDNQAGTPAVGGEAAAIDVLGGALTIQNSTFWNNGGNCPRIVSSNWSSPSVVTARNNTFAGNNPTFTAGAVAILYTSTGNAASPSTLQLTSNLFSANGVPAFAAGTGSSAGATFNLFDTAQAALPAGTSCAATTAGGANLCGVAAADLASLADNGGLTQTMALQAGSPAIDAGSNPGGLSTDQRGFARLAGAAVDIGAFEANASAPPTCTSNSVYFATTSQTVAEGAGSVTVTISRLGNCAGSVSYATVPGTATSPEDFDATSGTITLPADGPLSFVASIPIVDDGTIEATESFQVSFSSVGADTSVSLPNVTRVDILDDDEVTACEAALSADTYSVNEGVWLATVTVLRTGACAGSVDYSTAPGDATDPADFVATAGTLTWLADGPTSFTVSIPIIDDDLVEATESFTFELTQSDILIGLGTPSAASVEIVDNDVASLVAVPTLSEWGLAALALALCVFGARTLDSRREGRWAT